MYFNKKDGFTLVELIVVIAILAILAGVGVPTYTGYIEKAQITADQLQLSNLNTAFASACAYNGESSYNRTDVQIDKVSQANGWDFAVTTGVEDINNDLAEFYEGSEFKVISHLLYNPKLGCFRETSEESYALYQTLKETYGNEIASVAASNFGAIGTQTLMNEMAGLASWANNEGISAMGGAGFMKAIAGYLGITVTDDMSDEAVTAAVQQAMTASDFKYNPETFTANAIALYAAQNSDGLTMDNVSAWMGDDVDDLLASPNSTTLSEAAAIYGLYMSYAKETNTQIPSDGAFSVLNEAMASDAFKNWLDTTDGDEELEAYKNAMIMIDGAVEQGSAESILSNGFDDPELIELIESLIGS